MLTLSRRSRVRRLTGHARSRVLGFALWASAVGERRGVEWLTYNPLLMLEYHRYGLRDAPAVVQVMAETFPAARRYVDVGAGTGVFAAEAMRQGLDVIACERSRGGRVAAGWQGVPVVPFDLSRDPPADVGDGFDVGYCFEVAEHVPASLADRLVAFLASLAPTIVFTAAQPGQGGAGHVNEQAPGYWIERFERGGHAFDAGLSANVAARFQERGVWAPWLLHNVLVFRQRSPDAGVGA
jgi:SAM-dependent methyltransferase